MAEYFPEKSRWDLIVEQIRQEEKVECAFSSPKNLIRRYITKNLCFVLVYGWTIM